MTPAPWTLKRHATNHQTLTGATAGLIADIHKDEDASLISAAPELLSVLEWWMDQIQNDACDDMGKLLDDMTDKTRAVITKVLGEQA